MPWKTYQGAIHTVLNEEWIMKNDMKPGEEVRIKAIVDKIPQGDRTLYRVIIMGKGQALWVTRDQLEKIRE